MPYKFRRDYLLYGKSELLYLSDHLRQVRRLSSIDRRFHLKKAVFLISFRWFDECKIGHQTPPSEGSIDELTHQAIKAEESNTHYKKKQEKEREVRKTDYRHDEELKRKASDEVDSIQGKRQNKMKEIKIKMDVFSTV